MERKKITAKSSTQKRIYNGPVVKKEASSGEKDDTSWGGVSVWYDKHLQGKKTYHETLIYPNLIRLLGDLKGKIILDLACGQGIFSHKLASIGAKVTGVDLSAELIEIARKENKTPYNPDFFVSLSHDLYMVKDASVDIVIISLAIQNIEKVRETFLECKRVLKQGGKLFMVMNHPGFRIPKQSHWGFDDNEGVQYRRIDEYLSESKNKIDMTPGSEKDKKFTFSFHRPLQYYSKLLDKSDFLIKRLEEWESDKDSEKGPRQIAENKARKEIPLFLLIEAVQWKI